MEKLCKNCAYISLFVRSVNYKTNDNKIHFFNLTHNFLLHEWMSGNNSQVNTECNSSIVNQSKSSLIYIAIATDWYISI